MRKLTLLAVPLLLLISGCSNNEGGATAKGGGGNATVADPAKSVLLRLKPNEGDKYTTTLNMDMNMTPPQGQGQPMTMSMDVETQDEVTKVADGKVTIKSTITKAEGTGPLAATVGTMKGKTFTMVMDERGKIIDAGDLSANPMMGGSRPVYPEKEVKAGDTWTETIESGAQKIQANFKAEGLEMVDGKEAMKLTMTMSVPMGATPVEFPLTMWIDTANGRLIKGEGKMNASQQGMTVDMTMNMATK